MDDHLQRAALRIDDAEGILAEEIGRVGAAALLIHVAVVILRGRALHAQHRREAVLNKAHAVQLADLAVEQLLGRGVLMRLDPALPLAQVVRNGRVHNGVITPVYARNSVLFHDSHSLIDHGRGHQAPAKRVVLVVLVLGRAARRHLRAAGRGAQHLVGAEVDVVAVEDVGAEQERVADQLLLRLRRRRAHLLGRAEDHVVVGAQLELVGDGGVGAVLVDRAGDGRYAELLAGGDDALGQLRGAVEAVPLAPFDRAVVVGGEGLALGELGVDHLGARVFEQLGVVEALELGREGICGVEGAGHAGGGVDEARGAVDEAARVGEKLEVKGGGGVDMGHMRVSFSSYIIWFT